MYQRDLIGIQVKHFKEENEMVQFATRMNNLKGSAIRELLALANKPEILSFAGGMPAPELFPVEKMKAATATAGRVCVSRLQSVWARRTASRPLPRTFS